MAIVLQDYVDRVIDVLAFRGVSGETEVLLEQSLVDETSTGEICTGIQKLAQRFLLELLTERGSIPHALERGCDLLPTLLGGRARTTTDVAAIFALSELQVRLNLVEEETEDDPDDERYRQATLVGVVIQPGSCTLTVELQSLADEVKIILPISIVV